MGPRATRKTGWERLSLARLLESRICDLGLTIEGSPLEGRLARLEQELARAGLRFRPFAWLSSDWFTPDGSTGFAIPFFLAHPRLMRLERQQMLEVEGGTQEWCLKLLRHETAHALENAYRLRERKIWRETFGRASEPYRKSYRPNPSSRDYVLNLDYWYSQSHPLEDFAETFAVWLTPGSRWRKRYAGWPALKKLEVVDALMRQIRDRPPLVRSRAKVEPVSALRYTLREYYRRKQAHYDIGVSSGYDAHLTRLFGPPDEFPTGETATSFLRRYRRELRQRVSAITGQHAYLIDQVLNEMIPRSKKLGLRLRKEEEETLLDTSVLLTALTMSFLHGGHPVYSR